MILHGFLILGGAFKTATCKPFQAPSDIPPLAASRNDIGTTKHQDVLPREGKFLLCGSKNRQTFSLIEYLST